MIPKLEITERGILTPTTEEVTAGLWLLMRSCFGDNLNTSMDTPQGQLVTTLTAIITDERNQLVELFNQFDPRYAEGLMQDALANIYFLQRKQATRSVVELTFNGLFGVIIPAGFQVSDDAGILWETDNSATITNNGLATVNAACVTAGPIAAAAGTINRIVRNRSGIDSVSNNAAAIQGRGQETRQEFEIRRQQSVAKNAKNTNSATYGAVNNIKDVIDCYVMDNPSDETITVGKTNYPLIRNSIAVSVVGGDDIAIAKEILVKAGSGCSFVGNTLVVYEDTDNFPYMPPKYNVKFIRPTHIPVDFIVTFEDRSLLTYQQIESIKSAIVQEFTSGEGRGQIARRLIASDFICPISQQATNRLISVQVGRKGDPAANYVEFGIDEFPALSVDDIRIE